MPEVTIEQLQAEIAQLKRDNAELWQAINSIRHKPPMDSARMVRELKTRFNLQEPIVRR